MRFVSLSSGSRGNASLIDSGRTRILIDCGISFKRLSGELDRLGLKAGDLDGVVITHEHTDHIRGLTRLIRELEIPVYGTEGTLRSLSGALKDTYFEHEGRRLMESVSYGQAFRLGDIELRPFEIYHDAAEPAGFRMETAAGANVAVLTDCGHFDERLLHEVQGLDALLLEANHDIDMLLGGHYPDFLKRRILSPLGHMSNDDSGRLLARVASARLKYVLLGHLSRDNNTREKALSSVREELTREYLGGGLDISIGVAGQDEMSPVIEL